MEIRASLPAQCRQLDYQRCRESSAASQPQTTGSNIMSERQISNVVKHFGISPEWTPDFVSLIRDDKIENHDFRRLLKKGRFKAALNTCLEILSADWAYLFDDDGELERAQAIAGA